MRWEAAEAEGLRLEEEGKVKLECEFPRLEGGEDVEDNGGVARADECLANRLKVTNSSNTNGSGLDGVATGRCGVGMVAGQDIGRQLGSACQRIVSMYE